MIKRFTFITFFILAVITYAKVDNERLDIRVLELKSELKKQLHKKSYGNEVIGSYELQGDKVKFNAYMLPIPKRPKQKDFSITEIRSLANFDLISYKDNLPKYNINKKENSYLFKTLMGILGLIILMTSMVLYKKDNQNLGKRDADKEEEEKDKNLDIAA